MKIEVFGVPFLKKGYKIHIKKKNRGKFTKSAKAAGQSVQEHARSILNNPNATPLLKKRANFARNAAKWHLEGGIIQNKPKFEDWYLTVPPDRNDTIDYNLRKAYLVFPFEKMESWRTASSKDIKNGKYHLNTLVPYTNLDGSIDFLKSKNHKSIKYEYDFYNSDEGKEFKKRYWIDSSKKFPVYRLRLKYIKH